MITITHVMTNQTTLRTLIKFKNKYLVICCLPERRTRMAKPLQVGVSTSGRRSEWRGIRVAGLLRVLRVEGHGPSGYGRIYHYLTLKVKTAVFLWRYYESQRTKVL